jgi:hypothetical protein
MSKQNFPAFVDQPGCVIRNFSIQGAAVGETAGTTGLDGRGKFLCNISKDKNIVTITWTQFFGDRPYVFFQAAAGQNNTNVEIVTATAQQLVIKTVNADGTPINDANLDVVVFSYGTSKYVS